MFTIESKFPVLRKSHVIAVVDGAVLKFTTITEYRVHNFMMILIIVIVNNNSINIWIQTNRE